QDGRWCTHLLTRDGLSTWVGPATKSQETISIPNVHLSEESVTLSGSPAFTNRYASWSSADGMAAKVGAFVDGAGNFLAAAGLPRPWGVALMAVLVASFAATTLDTAVRLQRYVVQELLRSLWPSS